MSELNVSLLGEFKAIFQGKQLGKFRTVKVQALLIYLLVESAEEHPRSDLAELLWPGLPEKSARLNLRQILYQLRRAVSTTEVDTGAGGEQLLLATGQTVTVNPAYVYELDVANFNHYLFEAQSHDHSHLLTCEPCLELLKEAAALYRGPFLADFWLDDSDLFEDWALAKRESFRRQVLDALDTLTIANLRGGASQQAETYARRQLEIDDLKESAHRQLMESLARSGRREEALAQYERCQRQLRTELGMAPSVRTSALYSRIAAGEVDLGAPIAPSVRGYELLEEIGVGAFGAVHKAYQPAVDRQVAVKIILPQYANQPEFIRRFEVEAQTVARLEHPYIVPLYDYWREPNGAYLVMRYLQGGSLARSLAAGESWKGERAVQLVEQVASALEAAHRHGVVHRDIKPANILLDSEGNAFLTDFGIAKDILGRGSGIGNWGSSDEEEGSVTGSPAYISPEQILDEPVTAQSDIYSLGLVIYELLVGEAAYPQESIVDLLHQHLSEPVPLLMERLPGLPAEVDAVIQRVTAKRPPDRYANALELARAFRQAMAVPITAPIPWMPAIADEELINPYKGLRAFQEADAGEFFGREALVAQLLDRMGGSFSSSHNGKERFLAVVGPSGSGKSSAVKAGLIPALRAGALPGSEKWFIVEMAPGLKPMEELEAALLPVAVDPPASLMDPLQKDERGLIRTLKRILPPVNGEPGQLLLVVDQFEELFTLVEEEGERAYFIDSLLTAAEEPRSPLRVVVTLRADFYDRPLAYPELGELLRARTELVLPMSPEELEQAICEPAARAGAAVDPGLVASIIADVQEQPGMLPLLQYALTELFERRQDGRLTQDAYREIGGVAGALGRRAEEIYDSLDDEAQSITRQIFLRLVTLGEGIEDTRRRVLRSEIGAIQTTETPEVSETSGVLVEFGRARLLTFDRDPATREPTVEVAHEALLREWERLRNWLDESRDDVRLQRLLGVSVAEWLGSEQDPGFLLRGSRLTQFEDWAAETDLALTRDERSYLEASLEERRIREAAEAERQAHEAELERRSRNRLRAMVGIFAVAAVIAIALSIFAFDRQAAAQENEALAIEGQATATVAQGEAVFQAATAEAERVRAEDEAMARSTAQAEAEGQKVIADEQRIIAEEQRVVAEDQKAVAEDEARTALEAYSLTLATHAQKALDELDSATALALAMAASNIADSPKEVVQTLKRAAYAPGARQQYTINNPNGEVGEIWSLAVSPDGTTALLGLSGGEIALLDIESGEISFPFAGHSLVVTSLAFGPDGSLLLSGDVSGEVILWEVGTGEEIQRFSGPTGGVYTLDFSPDGKTAVSGSFAHNDFTIPGELFLWDLETGEQIRRFEGGHSYGLRSAAISPDGQTLLSGEYNVAGDTGAEPGSPLILWDLESGEIIHRFPAPLAYSESVVFHPDGRTAFAIGSNTIYQWDLETGDQIRVFEGHNNHVRMIDISHDGLHMISSDLGGGIILWDLVFGEPLARFSQAALRTYVSFLPDGRQAISSSQDGTVMLWDLFSANEIRRFEGQQGGVMEVEFTPDSKYILSAGGSHLGFDVPGVDNTIRVWEMETGEQVQMLEGHESIVVGVKVSPDGRNALTLSQDGTVIYWDLESGAELRRFNHPGNPYTIALHPDGKRALIGTGEPSLLVWGLDSGEVIEHLYGHEGWLMGLDVSPDGKTVLSGDHLGNLILWDLESGRQLRRLSYNNRIHGQLMTVIYSPDGSQVLTQSKKKSVVVWDTGTWEILKSFNQNEGESWIGMLALGPDGRTVASADTDGNVLVWDMESDEILHSISTNKRLPVWPEISPDGRYLLLGSQDHTVSLWDLNAPSLEELQAWIEENRHVREFSCQERVQYQVEPLCEAAALPEPLLMPPVAPEAGYVQPVYQAQVGENRGEIALGEWDIWLYEGRAGEVLTVTLEPDNPAPIDTPPEERIELGMLDTWLFVISPDAALMVMNDDAPSERVEGLVLPLDGTYQIHARSWRDESAGAYTLIIEVAEE